MLATFAYFFAVGILIPALPRFVKNGLEAGNFAVGVTIGSFGLAAVLIRPFIGQIGDARGRRVLIIAGGVLVGLSIVGYIAADSLGPLLLLRLVSGAGEAMFYVGAASVINDIAPDERRGEALSYFSLALFGGIAVGPVVGETILESASFDVAWLVAAAAALIAGLIGLGIAETRPEGLAQGPRRIVHPAALEPGTILATNIWALATFTTFVPLYALALGLSGSRMFFVLHSVVVFSIRLFGARIPDQLGPGKSARAALTLVALGMLVIGAWEHPAGLFGGTILYSIGHSLAFPALMTLAVRGAPASERSSVVATFTAFFDLSFGLGAVSAGAFAALLGYRGSFIASAVVALGGLALLFHRKRRAAALRPEPAA